LPSVETFRAFLCGLTAGRAPPSVFLCDSYPRAILSGGLRYFGP